MRAVERGNCETVELLAKNQASMQVVDVDGGGIHFVLTTLYLKQHLFCYK